MAAELRTYDTRSMLMHWAMAAMVFTVGMSSPWLNHVTRPGLSTYHNVVGTLALFAAFGWFMWQARRPALPALPGIGVVERRIMDWAVIVMNVTLILAPISGLVLLFGHGGTLGISSNTLGFTVPFDRATLQRLGLLHHVLGATLVVTAGGHALHAVWHHVVRRDRLLARMLPGHEQ